MRAEGAPFAEGIADDRAHGRRIESADPTGAESKARQGIGDVVFAAADPALQNRREFNL